MTESNRKRVKIKVLKRFDPAAYVVVILLFVKASSVPQTEKAPKTQMQHINTNTNNPEDRDITSTRQHKDPDRQ